MSNEETIETPRCEGEHFFENICNACGAAQPSGPCAICPHTSPNLNRMFGLPVPSEEESERMISVEHYSRRPCKSCGSVDLRLVRVRAPEAA